MCLHGVVQLRQKSAILRAASTQSSRPGVSAIRT
jgi:hypothetical protein